MKTINPEIIKLPATFLIGHRQTMSLANDETFSLWRSFGPRIREIQNRSSTDRFSMKIFPFSPGLASLTPETLFEKWAAVPVTDFNQVPDGLDVFTIPEGQYAVFHHKGTDERFIQTLTRIFTEWLPASGFHLDDRPHFEILGEKYKLNDPESEETIWIPIQPK
jgi:AraC family transcriptional regulator